MTKKTTITKNDATKLVSDFHTILASHTSSKEDLSEQFKVATRDALYQTLGVAYGSSLALVADPAILGEVCAFYGTKAPAEGENPHSAVVRMFWRKKQGNVYVPDKSAWKYGKGFRAAQALNWKPEDYAENLKTYKVEVAGKNGKTKKLGGHAALEAWDTKLHGNPEAQLTEQEHRAAQAWMAKTQPALATFNADLVENAKDQQMASVVVQYDSQANCWHVRAVNQHEHDRAWATIAKPTVKEFSDWSTDMAIKKASADLSNLPPEGDALFEALAAHNSEIDSRNARATWANRLVGFDTDGDFMWPASSRGTPPVTSSDEQDADSVAV